MDVKNELVSPKPSHSKSDEQPGVVPRLSSKEIQAGNNGSLKKTKVNRPTVRKKKKKHDPEEGTMLVDAEGNCLRHSFCVVGSLKQKGVIPFKPKGLPWSSGLLPYLPGQRPEYFEKSRQELAAIADKKKKIQKRKIKEKKRIMKRLREGDHKKLSHVLNTSQELMILMRIISMVMEKKKSELKRRIGGVQTDITPIPEEDEEEEEDVEDDEEEGTDEAEEDDEEGNEEINAERLPETFNEN